MYRLNIFHGSLHAGAWLAYIFGGRRASAKAVTPQLNWVIVAVVVPTAAIMLLADAVAHGCERLAGRAVTRYGSTTVPSAASCSGTTLTPRITCRVRANPAGGSMATL